MFPWCVFLSSSSRAAIRTPATPAVTLCLATPPAVTVMRSTLAPGTWWIQRCWVSPTLKEPPQTAALTPRPVAWPRGPLVRLFPASCSRAAGCLIQDTRGHRSWRKKGQRRRTTAGCTFPRATPRLWPPDTRPQTGVWETWARSHLILGEQKRESWCLWEYKWVRFVSWGWMDRAFPGWLCSDNVFANIIDWPAGWISTVEC